MPYNKGPTFLFHSNLAPPAKFRLDLPNGFYLVRAGFADSNAQQDRLWVNGRLFIDELVAAYTLEERGLVVEVANGYLEAVLGGQGTASNATLNWLLVEQPIYYQGDGPKQFGALANEGGLAPGFRDGTPPYDIGI